MAPARPRAERVVLPRRFPARAIGRIAGYLVVAGVAVAALWLLFGGEPKQLSSGMVNPLAYLPHLAVLGFGIGLIPVLSAVIRRPMVTADSYALTVRPGSFRTLVLPWVRISDIGIYPVTLQDDPEPILLVRCVERHGQLGDTPSWFDQGVLRSAAKAAGGAIGGYDVAVRLGDFVGDYRRHLGAITMFAPERVGILDRTASPRR